MTRDEALPPNRAEARERLAAARELGTTAARRGAAVGAVTTAAVGVLVAGALAAAALFGPDRPVAFAVSFVVYGLLLALLMVWHHRAQVVTHRGFGRAYITAFVVTITLYVVGVAALLPRLSWPLMTLYCVLVALPMLVAGARMVIGARR